MRLVVRDIAQLDTLLDGLAEYAQCNTSVVKSSPVKGGCHRCEFFGGGAAHLSGLPDGTTCSLAKRSASDEQQNRWLRVQQWWGRITRR